MWIPINGTYPHVGAVNAWLADPEMYRHTFYQAFWHTAGNGWGLVADLVPLSLAGLLLGVALASGPGDRRPSPRAAASHSPPA